MKRIMIIAAVMLIFIGLGISVWFYRDYGFIDLDTDVAGSVAVSGNEDITKTEKAEEDPVTEVKKILAESQPAVENFLACWKWREGLFSCDDVPELSGDIEKSFKVRDVHLVKSIEYFLNTKPGEPLPDCYGIDPMYAVNDLWDFGFLPKELAMRILEVQTKDNLQELHSDSWEEQKGARLYWQLTAGRFKLGRAELYELGLTGSDIENCLPE